MNTLFLTDELNYADGVTAHLYYLLSGLSEKNDLKLTVMCSGGDALEKFRDKGIEITVNENLRHRSRSIKGFLLALKSVSEYCKAGNVDIIHSHNHYAANIAASSLKIRISAKTKTVQTVHGIIPETGKLNHLSAGYYIAVNDHVYEYLKKKTGDENKISLIYNGIDFRKNISRTYNSRLRFVSAGRLEKGKRTDLFIKAVSKLSPSDREKAEFVIAGEGNEYEELRKLNEKINAGIEFAGLIKDLRKFFVTSDVFVMTSASEGLPMTILEAAAEKVLVITSDFDGSENILRNNTDGLVFSGEDPDELAAKLKSIIDKPEIISTFTDNFHNAASVKFNSVTMTEKHFDLYKKLMTQ